MAWIISPGLLLLYEPGALQCLSSFGLPAGRCEAEPPGPSRQAPADPSRLLLGPSSTVSMTWSLVLVLERPSSL